MLCEYCGKSNANFQYKLVKSGYITERNLCSECAEKYGYLNNENLFHNISDFLLPGFFTHSPAHAEPHSCPACGLTVTDVSETGRTGCDTCYSSFSDILEPYIRKLHGLSSHTGKVPAGSGAASVRRRIENLQRELDSAVSSQDFERAAVLRDEMRSLRDARGEGGAR